MSSFAIKGARLGQVVHNCLCKAAFICVIGESFISPRGPFFIFVHLNPERRHLAVERKMTQCSGEQLYGAHVLSLCVHVLGEGQSRAEDKFGGQLAFHVIPACSFGGKACCSLSHTML